MDLVQITEQKLRLEGQLKNGANWFYWIAVLSIVNAVLLVLNLGWSFIFGLGIVEIIDLSFYFITEEIGFNFYNTVGLIINTMISSIFILFGVLANKKVKWAFIAGIVLFALDGILMLVLGDFLSVAFHGFVLFGVFKGLKAIKQLDDLQMEIDSAREPNPDVSEGLSL